MPPVTPLLLRPLATCKPGATVDGCQWPPGFNKTSHTPANHSPLVRVPRRWSTKILHLDYQNHSHSPSSSSRNWQSHLFSFEKQSIHHHQSPHHNIPISHLNNATQLLQSYLKWSLFNRINVVDTTERLSFMIPTHAVNYNHYLSYSYLITVHVYFITYCSKWEQATVKILTVGNCKIV